MDTDSFIINVTGVVDKEIANDLEKRFDKSNFETERPLTISENENVVGLMKDEFCGKIMAEIV